MIYTSNQMLIYLNDRSNSRSTVTIQSLRVSNFWISIIDSDKKQFVSDETLTKLKRAVSKIEKGIEEKNDIEVEAYARAIPRILGDAEKEIYKASK